LNVYIEGGKITGIIKNWIEADSESGEDLSNQNLISSEKAVEKSNAELKKSGWVEIPEIKSKEIVYINKKGELLPVWEIKYDGITMQVDCIDESFLENSILR